MKKRCAPLILIFCLIGALSDCSRQKKEEKAFVEIIRSTGDIIAKMASACLSHARSYINVMEYAQLTGEDFDRVADVLLGEEARTLKEQLEESKLKIDEFMDGLEDFPPALRESFQKLHELHALYSKIHTLAVNPSGSMAEYSDSIQDSERQLEEIIKELDRLLQD